MRNVMLTPLMLIAALGTARAEGLFLNSVRTDPLITQDVVVSQSVAHVGQPEAQPQQPPQQQLHAAAAPSDCRGGCSPQSLGQYPGGCCERDGSCCAALWANYCRDKKPCWTPESPRRHVTCASWGIPCINPLEHLRLPTLGHWPGGCDAGATCDDCSALATSNGTSSPSPAPEVAPGTSTPETAPAPGEVDIPDNVVPETPEAEAPSARKLSLPFGWKLPREQKGNPFKSLPTARMKNPFSR